MKSNILGNGLLVLIGLLVFLAALQLMGWGRHISPVNIDDTTDKLSVLSSDSNGEKLHEVRQKPNIELMTQTPLFSDTRQPFVAPEMIEEGVDGAQEEAVEANPIQAKLTGIAIMPDRSYVMLIDQVLNKSITLELGMPLEGEQGAWVVEEIHPRKVIFGAQGQDPQELELEVYGQGLKAAGGRPKNRKAKKRQVANKQSANKSNNSSKQKNSAEEIRRKIAERRAQMRAEAAKRKE